MVVCSQTHLLLEVIIIYLITFVGRGRTHIEPVTTAPAWSCTDLSTTHVTPTSLKRHERSVTAYFLLSKMSERGVVGSHSCSIFEKNERHDGRQLHLKMPASLNSWATSTNVAATHLCCVLCFSMVFPMWGRVGALVGLVYPTRG